MTSQQRIPVMPEGTIYDASGRVIAPPQNSDSYSRPDGPWNQNGGRR
jgi:hypothetical protein